MESAAFCIEVILPLAVGGTFSYGVPEEFRGQIRPGMRVEVQFGQRKHYAAIVFKVNTPVPEEYRIKPILGILDNEPVVTSIQLGFWEWMAEYYMCSIGEVMQAALPSQLKLESTTVFMKNPSSVINILELEDDEYLVASALEQQQSLTLDDIQAILQRKIVVGTVKKLLDHGIMIVSELMDESYKPKLAAYVTWSEKYRKDTNAQRELLNSLTSRPQQMRLVLAFYDEINKEGRVLRSALLKRSGIGSSVLNTLVKNSILCIEEHEHSRLSIEEQNEDVLHALSPAQEQAYDSVKNVLSSGRTALLFGVTASGKTHVYVELIIEARQRGQQVLFLLPEIALTAQLISRLNKILGGIGVYHSKMSHAERTELWFKVMRKEIDIVVGARSALFLPFAELGLIVVDEEHDPSYKQQEPAPRYQARDAALVLAKKHHSQVVLGSATPSVESFYLAKEDKYGLVKMDVPYYAGGGMKFDLHPMTKPGKNGPEGVSILPAVREKIEKTLTGQGQVIIFQNRRGYAPFLMCSECAWIPECKNCDVSLTYHKVVNRLKCHYCGYKEVPPGKCRKCSSRALILRGIGTEKIEDELKIMFPSARIARLDQDAIRSKHGHVNITRAFEDHEIDILVGTQMVSKGLDFSDVGLVVVPQTDNLLYYPDFRAAERAFQLLYQVSGRTGRRNTEGEVCLQTMRPNHPLLNLVRSRDYESFYNEEIGSRRQFIYPPFCRLIRFTFYHKDKQVCFSASEIFVRKIVEDADIIILGPAEPSIGRIKNQYLYEVLVKLPRSKAAAEIKRKLADIADGIKHESSFRQLRIVADVDPY